MCLSTFYQYFIKSATLLVAFTMLSHAQNPLIPEDAAKNLNLRDQSNKNKKQTISLLDLALSQAKQSVSDIEKMIATRTDLKPAQQRVLAIMLDRAKLHEQLIQGKVTLFSDIQKQYPKLQQDTRRLVDVYTRYLNKTTELDHTHILKLIQPLGRFLKDAEHQKIDARISKEQSQEMTRLMEKMKTVSDDPKSPRLELTSGDMLYALQHLPIPISVKTKPGLTLYLQAKGGGLFANGLSAIEVTADQKGIATTTWSTKGDSVGSGEIAIRSPQAYNILYVNIHVVQPVLKPLESMVVVNPKQLIKQLDLQKIPTTPTPANPQK